MAWYEPKLRPIPVQVARNLALWTVGIPLIVIVLSPIGTAPLPDATGWKRVAMMGLPFVLAGAVLEAASQRFGTVGRRALGHGFSTALFMFVVLNVERFAAGNLDSLRLAKGLVALPVMALFFSVHPWITETYLSPSKPQAEPTA